MDKYEYKVRADEIKSLIAEGEFAEAVKIADTIDWRRVRSVMMLCTVSDLYKINRRYQESKDILLLAYEKHPTGRLIVYSLCELSIKMEEYVQAIEYYKEFVQIAPKDTGQYVLLYRLYEAQDVSLEERIAVLEDFKKRDYREKWAYELAYLYHRIGLATKCIEECDEMYLWFGEGKYVIKALELKALHVPLSADQQEKYNAWMRERDLGIEEEEAEVEELGEEEAEEPEKTETASPDIMSVPTTELPEVKTVDVGQYNTLNLQMALAESMKEILTEEAAAAPEEMPESQGKNESPQAIEEVQNVDAEDAPQDTGAPQAEEVSREAGAPSIVEKIIAPLLEETSEIAPQEPIQDTDEIQEINSAGNPIPVEPQPKAQVVQFERQPEPQVIQPEPKPVQPEQLALQQPVQPAAEPKPGSRPIRYDDVLSQEYDGQIRLVIPDVKAVEKQITGQLSIKDIMAEWEEMKKSNEQKRMEDVRKRILNQTDGLFADFDEATKSGLLEQLEKAFVAVIMQDAETRQQTADSDAVPDLAKTVAEISQKAQEKLTAAKIVKEMEKAVGIEDEEITESKSKPQESARTVRELTDEEQEIFGQYVHHKKSREQLIHTLDNMSMAACTGNVLITGEETSRTLALAKELIREMQYSDSNFSGKVAKISAAVLNKKDVAATLKKLSNGALIIEGGADLNAETVAKLSKTLEKDNVGLLLILEDTKKRMNKLLTENAVLRNNFNLRVDIEALNDEALVAYAKQYAEEMEYSIDEFGILALHTRIADRQTSDHEVSVAEVRELIDEAIYYANKKTPKHFVDILLAKRYDDEDMIILRENDFMHY